MAYPEQLFPEIEGTLGSLTTTYQPVALWYKLMREVMLSGANARASDWAFYPSNAVVKTGPDVETGATLYGVILGQKSNAGETDFVVIDNDADGTVTLDGTAALANTVLFMTNLPAATTNGTYDYSTFIFPHGIQYSAHMCILADGQDGTDTTTADIVAYAVYRTGATRLQ